jgi:cytochrome c oxidase cbb3-type subunit I
MMDTLSHKPGMVTTSLAVRHALGWLVFGNAVGLYLALLLLEPRLQAGIWTYGRWVPVHLNVQLYGWTSLPLVAWLFSIYQVDDSRHAAWGPAAVWAWTAALAIGIFHWLDGESSGKIFLDWKGAALWSFVAAQVVLWLVLAATWKDRRSSWSSMKRNATLAGLLALAMVPVSLVFASSPTVYPPIDRTTGGPTGSSLLGSALFVVGLMLLLPRVVAGQQEHARNPVLWWFFGLSWLVFAITEAIGGTHRDIIQIVSMLLLLPWVWLLPRDWRGFAWPSGSLFWRHAMFLWWGVLVVTGVLMYRDGVLDRIKFTQALVAHSHLAMAGFTTAFCALLCVLVTKRALGNRVSVILWQVAALVMILALAAAGWLEGANPHWMSEAPVWRTAAFALRALCGMMMFGVSLQWLVQSTKS